MNTDAPPIPTNWYFSRDGKVTEGPAPLNEIHSMIATGVLSPRSLVVAAGENVWKSVEEAFPELLPPPAPISLPPSLPPPLQASAPVPAPPVQTASVAPVGGNASSWFAKLGCVGKLAVVCVAGLLLLIVLAGIAGGPNRQELQAELVRVETEMMQLQSAAVSYQSKLTEAQFAQFIGGFAIGYGAMSEDGGLALDGLGSAAQATVDAEHASLSLEQIQSRFNLLAARRNEIVAALR